MFVEDIAISATGAVVFTESTWTNTGGFVESDVFSLHVFENGKVRTLITKSHVMIRSLTFICVGGKEQLLTFHDRYLILFDLELGAERILVDFSPTGVPDLCNGTGEDKALCVYLTEKQAGKPIVKVWELQVTLETCHSSLKVTLPGFSRLTAICMAGDFCIISGRKKDSESFKVSGVRSTDWQTKWEVQYENHPLRVVPGPQGTVFVLLFENKEIRQFSLKDGSMVSKAPLLPAQLIPHCMCTRDDTLYVPHLTSKPFRFMISKFRYIL